jgi:quercetin dioxygenase-like cupin family protein
MGANSEWGAGRAGMRYRDLIPDRQGGRFIASHIQIPDGGPVPDYVHFHKIRFQAIYCYKGWVRVAYEDQGKPMTLQAGDCFLQPPTIRHRVLECSDGLEVIEIGCPAAHETHADHELELPNWTHKPEREFAGQRFVHHIAKEASWAASRLPGFEYRDLGIAEATKGLAGMRVHRIRDAGEVLDQGIENEFLFFFLLTGKLRLHVQGQEANSIQAGDCWVLPAMTDQTLSDCSQDVEILEVSLPGKLQESP